MIDSLLARAEINRMFDTTWRVADWIKVQLSSAPLILYEGRDSGVPPESEIAYCRVTINPADAFQSSLPAAYGQIRYENTGIINVQSFCTLSVPNALETSEYMATIAKRIYEGKVSPNGMTFKNCRTQKIGAAGGWYQFNTLINYQFDEMR